MDTSWDDQQPSGGEPVAGDPQAPPEVPEAPADAPAAIPAPGDPMVVVASDRIAEIVRTAEQTAE